MKRLLFFSFILLLVLSSCNYVLDSSDKDILIEAINNYDIKDNRKYCYAESDNIYNFSVSEFDNVYSFNISNDSYKWNLNNNEIYKNNELLDNIKFDYPDQFVKYVYESKLDGTLISFDDFIPFIKDIFKNSEEIKRGRYAPESRISDSYYYSVSIKEELIIESSIYNKLKIAFHHFNENKDEDIKVSIIASIENKKIDTVIEFSINDNCIFYL